MTVEVKVAADPRPVNLRGDEIADLSAEQLERHRNIILDQMYGADWRTRGIDPATGEPRENGRGSALQPCKQSIDAYRTWCKDEPDYEVNLARMESELREYQAKQRAARGKVSPIK